MLPLPEPNIGEGLHAETKQAYQTADYLLLENLEDMCGKESCQQFIASVICNAVAEGHQVMLTSAVDLQSLEELNERILNCECGILANVTPYSIDRGDGDESRSLDSKNTSFP